MYNRFSDLFSKIKFENNFNTNRKATNKALPLSLLIVLIVFLVSEYLMLIPLNYRSPSFIMFMIILTIIFVILYSTLSVSFNKISKYGLTFVGLLFVYLIVGFIASSEIFNASSYQKQLILDKKADFYTDNPTISYQSIPVVDRESAEKLGDRKMGQIVDYVSQFEVDSSYEQINLNNTPVRVTPLEYSDFIKWVSNRSEGLPAYIKVDMVSQESTVVKLKEGMKYSKSEHFGRNIERHLRANYPTLMFDNIAFEVNDSDVPYWVAPVYNYKIGIFGGKDITGAVLVNAINGEHKYYDVDKVPSWVDRVYPAELVISQLENYGKYSKGYFNTLFSQKGVLQPTDGYNYIALNDDVYLYTGLTSVSKDSSNVGFALINLRTKEGKYYNISGAEEYSAMSSAEGKVQNLKYSATFPILINAGGQPTYFMSLKDSSNLVKKYAFVSVENYQIVATGDTVNEAEKAYYEVLSSNGKTSSTSKKAEITGVISEISSAVKEGNSTYYFKLEGNDTIYISDISISNKLPLAKVGDNVTINYLDSKDNEEVISSIKFNN